MKRRVLVAGADAGIAVFHRSILRQTFETRKGLISGPPRFVAKLRTFETRGLTVFVGTACLQSLRATIGECTE